MIAQAGCQSPEIVSPKKKILHQSLFQELSPDTPLVGSRDTMGSGEEVGSVRRFYIYSIKSIFRHLGAPRYLSRWFYIHLIIYFQAPVQEGGATEQPATAP